MNKKILLISLLISTLHLTGCSWNEGEDPTKITSGKFDQELEGLFPSEEGFKWQYFGTADYGQTMWIERVYQSNSQKIIKVKGEINDLSGGSSPIDYSLQMTYAIEPDRVVQSKISEAMMDSEYDKLTLIMTPLEIGTQWKEEVIDSQGKKETVTGEIIETEDHPEGRIYKVLYSEDNSDYSEVRKIQSGRGVVDFLKTMKYQTESIDVGYHIYKTNVEKKKESQATGNVEEELIKGTIYNFDESWTSFVNNGSDDVYKYVLENSPAYNAVKSFIPGGKKQKFETIEVKTIAINGTRAQVKVFEKLRQENKGNVEFIEYNWIYTLVKIGSQWYVDSYIEDGDQ